MRLLLDTHTLLWFLWNDARASSSAIILIKDPANHIQVSIASCWEIAIKAGTGKLQLGESSQSFLARELAANNLDLLPITLAHATAVESLPHHHGDPFDRLLIAQALLENVPLVGADLAFDAYGVQRLW